MIDLTLGEGGGVFSVRPDCVVLVSPHDLTGQMGQRSRCYIWLNSGMAIGVREEYQTVMDLVRTSGHNRHLN